MENLVKKILNAGLTEKELNDLIDKLKNSKERTYIECHMIQMLMHGEISRSFLCPWTGGCRPRQELRQ